MKLELHSFSVALLRFVLMLFLGFVSCTAFTQVKFYTKTDARKIIQGSYIDLQFVLENAQGSSFQAPPFTGFDKISGPGRSTSTKIINGKRSSSMAYTYTLAGNKTGKFTIAPATINVNGKKLNTQPIIIEVIKGNKKSLAGKNKSFVRVELNDTTAYVGQQILLDYKLYTTEEVLNYNIDSQPAFDGFYVEDIRMSRQNFQREIIDGVEYSTQILRRYALFPQQTGSYKIEASNVTLGISTGEQSRGFFFSQRTRPYRTITNEVNILVDNAPSNAPIDFSGAIGSYRMSAKSQKRTISTDQALTVTMEIVGDGDNRMVLAPEWDLPEGIDMYDPNIIDENTYHQGNKIVHKKVFEYLIIAEKTGKFIIQPGFSYYDVASNKYVSLKASPINLTVYQGEAKYDKIDLGDDLKSLALIAPKTKFSKKDGGFYNSILHLGLLGLIVFGIIGVFYKNHQLKKSGQLDPKFEIQQNAIPKFKAKLEKCKDLIDQNQGLQYYEDLIIGFKSYLQEKHEIGAMHLKKEELLDALVQQDFDKQSIDLIEQLLLKSEQALYAPIGITDMEKTQLEIENWLNQQV